MALILNGTTGITVTDGSNILQDGTVTTDDLANAAVTSAKMATGAAATNLGNYVQSFNGSTGAVTGVSTFNGATGAVTGVSTVNGSTGAVTVQATLVSGTNIKSINGTSLLGSGDLTVGASTTFGAVGTYAGMWFRAAGAFTITAGDTYTAGTGSNQVRLGAIRFNTDGGSAEIRNASPGVSGTWRYMGATISMPSDEYTYAPMLRIS